MYYGNISDFSICASGNNFDATCSGDAGGPLTIKDSKVTELIGIHTFVKDHCLIDFPQGFTRITHYLKWIKFITGIAYY